MITQYQHQLSVNAFTKDTVTPHLTLQPIQNLDFNSPLLLKALLIPDDLQRAVRLCLMVVAFDDLSETPFAQQTQNLISVADMVVFGQVVVSPRVIVPYNYM